MYLRCVVAPPAKTKNNHNSDLGSSPWAHENDLRERSKENWDALMERKYNIGKNPTILKDEIKAYRLRDSIIQSEGNNMKRYPY